MKGFSSLDQDPKEIEPTIVDSDLPVQPTEPVVSVTVSMYMYLCLLDL